MNDLNPDLNAGLAEAQMAWDRLLDRYIGYARELGWSASPEEDGREGTDLAAARAELKLIASRTFAPLNVKKDALDEAEEVPYQSAPPPAQGAATSGAAQPASPWRRVASSACCVAFLGFGTYFFYPEWAVPVSVLVGIAAIACNVDPCMVASALSQLRDRRWLLRRRKMTRVYSLECVSSALRAAQAAAWVNLRFDVVAQRYLLERSRAGMAKTTVDHSVFTSNLPVEARDTTVQ